MVLDVRGTLLGTTNVSLVPLMAPFPSMGGNVTRDGHPCRFAPLVVTSVARLSGDHPHIGMITSAFAVISARRLPAFAKRARARDACLFLSWDAMVRV